MIPLCFKQFPDFSLMMYSCGSTFWKIGDFGLTSTATSKGQIATKYSRGTCSYRSPELLREGRFNNKADIWALGCIVYELFTANKAFISRLQLKRDHSRCNGGPNSGFAESCGVDEEDASH